MSKGAGMKSSAKGMSAKMGMKMPSAAKGKSAKTGTKSVPHKQTFC